MVYTIIRHLNSVTYTRSLHTHVIPEYTAFHTFGGSNFGVSAESAREPVPA